MKTNGRITGLSINGNALGRPRDVEGRTVAEQSALAVRFRKLLADQRKRLTDMMTVLIPASLVSRQAEVDASKLVELTRLAIDEIEGKMNL